MCDIECLFKDLHQKELLRSVGLPISTDMLHGGLLITACHVHARFYIYILILMYILNTYLISCNMVY